MLNNEFFWKSKACGALAIHEFFLKSKGCGALAIHEFFLKSKGCGLSPQGYSPWTPRVYRL